MTGSLTDSLLAALLDTYLPPEQRSPARIDEIMLDEMRAYARKKQQLRAAAEADGTLVDRSLPVLYGNNEDDCDGYEDW